MFLPGKRNDCPDCSCNETEVIDWKNVMTLSFATSIDAAATGLISLLTRALPGGIGVIGVTCFFSPSAVCFWDFASVNESLSAWKQ